MHEISFQMNQRKETLLNAYGETKERDLLYVTSTFLRCFYPLLKSCQTGEFPDSGEVHKRYNLFLRIFKCFYGRIEAGTGILHRGAEVSELASEEYGLTMELFSEQKPESIIFYASQIVNDKMQDHLAASVWLESILMYCAIYYWLAPKVVGKNKCKGENTDTVELRRKPSEMVADMELSTFNKDSKENKIIHAALDIIKGAPREKPFSHITINPEYLPTCPFTPPLLGELLAGINSYRIKAVQMDLDLRYPKITRKADLFQVPHDQWMKMRPNSIHGVKYKVQILLQLAWLEILHAIEHDIYVNTCEFCGKALLLHKQYSKKLCSRKKCKKMYDHQQSIIRKERNKQKLYQSKKRKDEVVWREEEGAV